VLSNVLDGNTLSGISIGPEYGWGKGEADYVTGLYISGNTFTSNSGATGNVGYNGGILIHGEGAKGNQNITITGNHFNSIYGANIIVQWANGVNINNNSFVNANQVAEGDPTVVSLSNANAVSFANNVVASQGNFGTSYFLSGSGVTNTTGGSNGFYYGNIKTYEAENAVLTDCAVGGDSTASGGHTARLIVNPDSTVKFTVNVPVAGTYPILAYYDNGNTTSGFIPTIATWNASVNGTGAAMLSLPYTFGWNSFSPVRVAAFSATLNTGNNTIQFACGRSSADMDKIVVLMPQKIDQSVYYKLFNQNSGKVLAVVNAATNAGAPIQQFTDNGTPDHNWKFTYTGAGYYKLVNQNSGLELGGNGANPPLGSQVIQYGANGAQDHLWQLIDSGSGYYKVVNKGTGLLLDVTGASLADGALVDQYSDNGGANQHWQMR